MEEESREGMLEYQEDQKGSTGQTYEEKDQSTRSFEEAQRTCPTTLILVIESITITL